MKNLQVRFFSIIQEMTSVIAKDKKLVLFLVFLSNYANAQSGFDQVGDNMWEQAGPTYKLISVFVLLSGLFFLGKGIIEGLRGEQGAWVKIGGSLLVFAVWFFAVPPLINFLSSQVKNQNFNNF